MPISPNLLARECHIHVLHYVPLHETTPHFHVDGSRLILGDYLRGYENSVNP